MFNVFVDMDGVLADFDLSAKEVLGMHPQHFEDAYGTGEFWKRLHAEENFFLKLKPMNDAHRLMTGITEMGHLPIILTGVPRSQGCGLLPAQQKIIWANRYFPATPVITCPSREKRYHMKAHGDVLIDDLEKYQNLWLEHGGVFILHTSAEESLRALTGYTEQRALM